MAHYLRHTSPLTYEWLVDGTPIDGATKADYVPTADDLATDLSLQVTAAKAGGQTATRTSAALTVDQGRFTAPTPAVGRTR